MLSSMTRRTLARLVVSALCVVGALASCAKDPLRVDRNRPPVTYLVAAPAESAGASYKIHLYWRGEDPDGYISGFLWSWDDSTVGAFRFTTKTDSIFELTVNDSASLFAGTGQQQPGQSQPHTFYIRAVDNLGKADPRLAFFNRRVYRASTDRPTVRFVGAIPSGAEIDTLCDGQPFSICWTGSDVDGYVNYYRWDVGIFSGPLSRDTCVVFNDTNNPASVSLISGVYTLTVTAVDNAFARSDPALGGRTLFVANHDPETQILGQSGSTADFAIGHYIQPFLNGQPFVNIRGTFREGETVPFRSTVWWEWIGSDSACSEPNTITGYSAVLRGTHRAGNPYITGFRYFLCNGTNGSPIYFTTNDPDKVLNECNFEDLVLDSLDAGYNMIFNVTSRDNSGRADGTPASFRFNCNFAPTVENFTVEDAVDGTGQPAKRFRWQGRDLEDGLTVGAELVLDGLQRRVLTASEQEAVISESVFRLLSPENPHIVEVRVRDRAGVLSEETLSVTFNVTYPP